MAARGEAHPPDIIIVISDDEDGEVPTRAAVPCWNCWSQHPAGRCPSGKLSIIERERVRIALGIPLPENPTYLDILRSAGGAPPRATADNTATGTYRPYQPMVRRNAQLSSYGRCWNCWGLGHDARTCWHPRLSPSEAEILRIKRGILKPRTPAYDARRIADAAHQCHNCWSSTEHTAANCPEEKRSHVQRDNIRESKEIPLTRIWLETLRREELRHAKLRQEKLRQVPKQAARRVLRPGKIDLSRPLRKQPVEIQGDAYTDFDRPWKMYDPRISFDDPKTVLGGQSEKSSTVPTTGKPINREALRKEVERMRREYNPYGDDKSDDDDKPGFEQEAFAHPTTAKEHPADPSAPADTRILSKASGSYPDYTRFESNAAKTQPRPRQSAGTLIKGNHDSRTAPAGDVDAHSRNPVAQGQSTAENSFPRSDKTNISGDQGRRGFNQHQSNKPAESLGTHGYLAGPPRNNVSRLTSSTGLIPASTQKLGGVLEPPQTMLHQVPTNPTVHDRTVFEEYLDRAAQYNKIGSNVTIKSEDPDTDNLSDSIPRNRGKRITKTDHEGPHIKVEPGSPMKGAKVRLIVPVEYPTMENAPPAISKIRRTATGLHHLREEDRIVGRAILANEMAEEDLLRSPARYRRFAPPQQFRGGGGGTGSSSRTYHSAYEREYGRDSSSSPTPRGIMDCDDLVRPPQD